MSKLIRIVSHALLLVFHLATFVEASVNDKNSSGMFPSEGFLATTFFLYADSVGGMPNDEVTVPVRVKDFVNMITAQGTISFDPSVLNFIEVTDFGLTGLGSSNFGTTQTENGKLLFSWDDATLQGKSVTDDAIIFSIRFKITGSYGASSFISFIDTPVPLEFIDNNFAEAVFSTESGKVQVPMFSVTTGSLAKSSFCTGEGIEVAFTEEGDYFQDNIFSAQLSDANGSFASPTNIGTGQASPIAAVLPEGTAQGSGYRIRVIASSPAVTGTNNGSDITINPTPAIPVVISGSSCGAGAIALSASGASTGESYRWYTDAAGKNPISGAESSTYTTPELTATTTYYVSIRNSAGCESEIISVVAAIYEQPSAPVTTSAGRCGWGSVTLSASGAPDAGSYRWYKEAEGGTAISGATSASYSTPVLNTTTTYYVSVVSSELCESGRTAVTASVSNVPATPTASAAPAQVGGNLRLSAGTIEGADYSWFGPNGFNSALQNPVVPDATTEHSGTYSVVATIDGCSSAAGSVEVTVVDVPAVTFDADSVSGLVGSEILVPVKVKGFTNIMSMQYSLNWDPAIATFIGVEGLGLTSLTEANFGISQTAEGNLMLSWMDTELAGLSLADGVVLFNLRFKLSGSKGQSTPVTISGSPTAIEVTESTNAFIVPVNALAGAATILTEVKISGKIKTENGGGIPSATVTSSGGSSPVVYETAADGLYEFEVMQGGTYTISPFKNNDATAYNGITTLDIAMIRRHILEREALTSPYKILAADADNSGGVSTTDIASVRKVILTIDDYFPVNKLWTFVPENFRFTDPANPFPFKDSVQVHEWVTEALSGQDFIGVKIGDVSNSWDSSNARTGAVGQINVQLKDRQVVPGSEIVVPVRVYQFRKVGGYQFTLSWDSEVLEFVAVEQGALEGAFGTHKVEEGKLTTSWDDAGGQSQSLTEGSAIFFVKFKAIGSLGTESELSINSSLTSSLAFNHNLKQLAIMPEDARIQLRSTAIPEPEDYALYQNVPNPINEWGTTISFSIPWEEEVRINIYNSVGQLIREYKNTYAAGEHEIHWDGRNSNGHPVIAGTYFYRMSSGEFTDAKRASVQH